MNKELAKQYADAFHKVKTYEEVLNDINQKIGDASLKGEYSIDYKINSSNDVICNHYFKNLFTKELGFQIKIEQDSDIRSGNGEINSIKISWR